MKKNSDFVFALNVILLIKLAFFISQLKRQIPMRGFETQGLQSPQKVTQIICLSLSRNELYSLCRKSTHS